MKVVGTLVFLSWALVAGGVARADLVYEFFFDEQTYYAEAGESVDVTLGLRETVTGSSTTAIGDSNNGLVALGSRLVFNENGLPFSGSFIGSENDVTPNETAFDFPMVTLNAGEDVELDFLALGSLGVANQVASNVYELEFATARFTASSLVGDLTTIGLEDLDLVFDNTITQSGTVLDSSISSATGSIITVPEPVGIPLIAGVFGIGLLVRRRRSRRSVSKTRSGCMAPGASPETRVIRAVCLLVGVSVLGWGSEVSAQGDLNNVIGVASVSGKVEGAWPFKLGMDKNESGKTRLVMEQDQRFVSRQDVDHKVSGPGTYTQESQLQFGSVENEWIRVYLISRDPISGSGKVRTDESVTFTQEILGVIPVESNRRLFSSSDARFKRYEVGYPTRPKGELELDPGSATRDSFTISSDRKTISFTFRTKKREGLDQMRVITRSGPGIRHVLSTQGGVTTINRADVAGPTSVLKNGFASGNIVVVPGKSGVILTGADNVSAIRSFDTSGNGNRELLQNVGPLDGLLVHADTANDTTSNSRPTLHGRLEFDRPVFAIGIHGDDINGWYRKLKPAHLTSYPNSGHTLEMTSSGNNRDVIRFRDGNRTLDLDFRTINSLDSLVLYFETPEEEVPTRFEFTPATIPENKRGALGGRFGRASSPLAAQGYSLAIDTFRIRPGQALADRFEVRQNHGNYELWLKPGQALNYEAIANGEVRLAVEFSGLWKIDGQLDAAYQVDEVQQVVMPIENFVELNGNVVINDGETQRSRVTRVQVPLDQQVTRNGQGFAVLSGGLEADIQVGPVVDSRFEITFPEFGVLVDHGSLADGNYDLVVNPSQFGGGRFDLDQNGDPDADGQAIDPAEITGPFYRRFGDADGDGTVTDDDMRVYRSTHRKSASDDGYQEWMDFQADGQVDARDFREFRKRWVADNPR